METVKKLLGLVVGIFCVLIVAWLCSFCFKMDAEWYAALNKPPIVPANGWFPFFVITTYASTIFVIARLVCGRHLFPAILIFILTGFCAVMFVHTFFALKEILIALIFSCGLALSSFALFVRFIIKDVVAAIMYLPATIFNSYAFIVNICIAMLN